MTELLYVVRQTSERAWQMAVFEEGRDMARDVYHINGSKCWCPSNKPRCKHLDILDEFRARGLDRGLVYDLESGKFTQLLGQ